MNKKILLIEDDFFIRDIYVRFFALAGYKLDVATDGEQAVTLTQNTTYDLILLDIMLPKLNGLDLLCRFRSLGSKTLKTPIFLITNLGNREIIAHALKMGANKYFLKAHTPPEQLVSEVNEFFQTQKPQEESAKVN